MAPVTPLSRSARGASISCPARAHPWYPRVRHEHPSDLPSRPARSSRARCNRASWRHVPRCERSERRGELWLLAEPVFAVGVGVALVRDRLVEPAEERGIHPRSGRGLRLQAAGHLQHVGQQRAASDRESPIRDAPSRLVHGGRPPAHRSGPAARGGGSRRGRPDRADDLRARQVGSDGGSAADGGLPHERSVRGQADDGGWIPRVFADGQRGFVRGRRGDGLRSARARGGRDGSLRVRRALGLELPPGDARGSHDGGQRGEPRGVCGREADEEQAARWARGVRHDAHDVGRAVCDGVDAARSGAGSALRAERFGARGSWSGHGPFARGGRADDARAGVARLDAAHGARGRGRGRDLRRGGRVPDGEGRADV